MINKTNIKNKLIKNKNGIVLCCFCFLFSCQTLPFDSMTLTQTGGFSGSEVYYLLNKRGTVTYFNGLNSEGKKMGRLRHTSRNEISTLYHLLQQLPQRDEYANMTRKITVSDSSGVHTNIWGLGAENSTGHDAIYNYIQNLIQFDKP